METTRYNCIHGLWKWPCRFL